MTASTYDAFLSYSSADAPLARKIHRFLESYRTGPERIRVRVFFDRTDIRGGPLPSIIRSALADSRTLVVCSSPAAAESRWVSREIEEFRELHGGEGGIALAILRGDPRQMVPLFHAEPRFHDLRAGWRRRLTRPGDRRLELLRLLAFVTNVELRTLRNWHLRRTLATTTLTAGAAVVPLGLLLGAPVDHWTPLDFHWRGGQRVYAVAAEATESGLWVAARFRGGGPQGFRNYIRVTTDALKAGDSGQYPDTFALGRRLLPAPLVPRAWGETVRKILQAVDPRQLTDRNPKGAPFVGQPRPGKWVIVQPLSVTDDERQEALIDAVDTGGAVPESWGSIVVVSDGESRAAVVPGLAPFWVERASTGEPTSPARGLAIAWADTGYVWIGVPGWDAVSGGGLWRSADAGKTWSPVAGFSSVGSLELRAAGRRHRIVAAEWHYDRWQGIVLEPYPSRVVESILPDGAWTAAAVPPFGTRSEVELAGIVGGQRFVRVDENIYRYGRLPLWRWLLNR